MEDNFDKEPLRVPTGIFNGLLASAVLWVLIALAFLFAIKTWADTPIVYKSWETQQCVRVDDPAGEHDCGNLPDKYELEWLQ